MPKPFLNKLIVHGAIGFFCVLFGCIYGFVTDDQIFLLMSLCIGVGTVIRIVSLLHTIKMHDYFVHYIQYHSNIYTTLHLDLSQMNLS